jgi:hypothetical protein
MHEQSVGGRAVTDVMDWMTTYSSRTCAKRAHAERKPILSKDETCDGQSRGISHAPRHRAMACHGWHRARASEPLLAARQAPPTRRDEEDLCEAAHAVARQGRRNARARGASNASSGAHVKV